MSRTLKQIAALLDDGDGPGLSDLLEVGPFPRLDGDDRAALRTIIEWVFIEESELRPAHGGSA